MTEQKINFWLVSGFDRFTLRLHIPDPGLFRTEQEASDWCKEHSNKGSLYGYQMVRLGRMT